MFDSYLYYYLISFINISERPIVNRKYLTTYIIKKNYRLDMIPLLVDIIWHAPTFCHKYCVCNFASRNDRIIYYKKCKITV